MGGISRRQWLGMAAGALVGGLGRVLGNTDSDETQGVFRTDSFKHVKLIDKPLKNIPYVSNIVLPIGERARFFNLNNPSFSYPIALGIMFKDEFEGMLKLTLVNVDTHETVFSDGARVRGDEKLNSRGVYHIVNTNAKNRIAPFYLYRAEWEMDGVYLSCLPFGRALRRAEVERK